MAKKRYKFNPQTLTYEVITIPFRIKFYRALRKVLIGFILASIVNVLFSFFFYTPKMYRISRDNNELLIKYNMLNDKLRAATARLQEIRHRDNSVYRSLFGTDSLNMQGIYTPYPDSKYKHLNNDLYTPLMVSTWKELDENEPDWAVPRVQIARRAGGTEQKQGDDLLAEAIPAIWPVNKRNLRGHIGAFGTRRHPVTGRIAGHQGIDLGGRVGDPVYATGNGRVAFNNEGERGYGKQVLINHGFGYKTRYAHLSKILVAPGQYVRRGELIGEVGSTGRSTGPHLHYEVIYRGLHVDPLNYFSRDMSEEEFAKIVESAQATTYETE